MSKFNLQIENDTPSSDEYFGLLSEGQLAVDVFQTEEEIVVVAPMAGARPEKIELHIRHDVLTIRGERLEPMPPGAEKFYSECFWGAFSRTVVLPVEVRSEMARADYKNGVLSIFLPKERISGAIPITIVEE